MGKHILAAVVGAAWLGLNVLLAYLRPHELLWLAGSVVLGVIFFWLFYLYVVSGETD